jgi:hypothetical protein
MTIGFSLPFQAISESGVTPERPRIWSYMETVQCNM